MEKPINCFWRGYQIDPKNIPLPLPGIYLIENVTNGKGYIGASKQLSRRASEHKSKGRAGKQWEIAKALNEFGSQNFKFIPLYYINKYDAAYLHHAEGQLIKLYNTLENGYNVEATRGKRGDKYKLSLSGESKQAMGNSRRGHIWITNGNITKSIPSTEPIPDGWRPGKDDAWKQALRADHNSDEFKAKMVAIAARPEVKAAVSAAGRRVWITNGVTSRRIQKEDAVPAGWKRGRIRNW